MHRGMAEQKAPGNPRILADVENTQKDLRDRQGYSNRLLSVPQLRGRKQRPGRYVSNLYAAGLAPADTIIELVAAVLADFARLLNESCANVEPRRVRFVTDVRGVMHDAIFPNCF